MEKVKSQEKNIFLKKFQKNDGNFGKWVEDYIDEFFCVKLGKFVTHGAPENSIFFS